MTQDQIDKASCWIGSHKEHVQKLIDGDIPLFACYEPSGYDASNPELWKPAHWRWFIHARKTLFELLAITELMREHLAHSWRTLHHEYF